MNRRIQSHFLWGPYSPLSSLTACFLLVIASSRLAFAVFTSGAILWVYLSSALVYFFARRFMPARGKSVILLFFSSFMGSIYLLLTGFMNPLTALGNWFFVVLVPPCLIGSDLLPDLEGAEPMEALTRVFLEASGLGLLLIGLSLIREPLGFGSLSFPGGRGGIMELFHSVEDSFFPVRFLSLSSGGLLLLGYLTAVYYYFRQLNTPRDMRGD